MSEAMSAGSEVQRDRDLPWLPVAEFATVAALFLIALAFARPQLEGWSVLSEYRASGVLSGIVHFWESAPTRWFEPVPLAVAWLLGHGSGWAVGAVYGAELAAKYAIIRWGVSPFFRGPARWFVATLASVMVPWSGVWRAHIMAPQLSALFLLAAFAALARHRHWRRGWWAVLAAAGVFLSLVTYEALILCALALPITVAILQRKTDIRKMVRLSIPVAIGIIAFLLVFGTILFLSGRSSYQARGLQGQDILGSLPQRLALLYSTGFGRSHLAIGTLTVILGIAVSLAVHVRKRRLVFVTAALAVLALPWLSLPYLESTYHLADAERVTLPISFGFLLICVAIFGGDTQVQRSTTAYMGLVLGLLASALVGALDDFQYYRLQRSITSQIRTLLAGDDGKPVRVRDWSGRLGDKYTFMFPGTLQQALDVLGYPVDIDLCFVRNVELIHPDLNTAGWQSVVQRCQSTALANPPIDLDVHETQRDRSLVISRPTNIQSFVASGSIAGTEGKLQWINESTSTIEVHNYTSKQTPVTWTALFVPPPCPKSSASISLTIDDRTINLEILRDTQEFIRTQLNANETKLIKLDIHSAVCRLTTGDMRPFYLGLINMHAVPSL